MKKIFFAIILCTTLLLTACGTNTVPENSIAERFKLAKLGDYITFGSYEQDNDSSNGTEAIEWLVLDVTDDKILVISRYGLDCQPYNKTLESVTWETCTLRKWLNEDFLNAAFTDQEKAMIPITRLGNVTQDKVFLLSTTEANEYFSFDNTRQCEVTDYAIENGSGTYWWWWLRSPNFYSSSSAPIVYTTGDIDVHGRYVDYALTAVRPALWIDLNA